MRGYNAIKYEYPISFSAQMLPNVDVGGKLYYALIERFYHRINIQNTLDDKRSVLYGNAIRAFIQEKIENMSQHELDQLYEYFNRLKTEADRAHDKRIELLRHVKNGRSMLIENGYIKSPHQTSAAFWARPNELITCIKPLNPKIDAAKETALNFSMLALAETVIGVSIHFFDKLSDKIDILDYQLVLTPTVYIITLLLIVGKGLYDYQYYQNAHEQFTNALKATAAQQRQYDRDIATVVLTEIIEQGERLSQEHANRR